jgi:NAD+ synthase
METEQPARGPDASLQLDPAIEIERISGFIRDEVRRRGARGVVIGLSGGLDSTTCAYLCRRSLPAKQIHLLSLPERDSSAAPRGHAQSVARALGLPLEEQNLSELFGRLGLYEQVPPEVAGNRPLLERSIGILRRLSRSPALYPWAQEYAFGRRRGLLAGLVRRWLWRYPGMTAAFIFGKVRARALALSIKAMQMDCLLVCTTDRSEWSVGFYDPHGDGAGDLAPLCHLYKTQIRELARALGVAEEILRQPSSGDLAGGLPNETAIGLPYEQLDRVLAGLSLGMADDAVAAEAGVGRSMVKAIRSACRLADERRRLPVSMEAGDPHREGRRAT